MDIKSDKNPLTFEGKWFTLCTHSYCIFGYIYKAEHVTKNTVAMSTQSKPFSFKGQRIFVGLDVHLRSWSVTVLSEQAVLKKFTQDPSPVALNKFLTNTYPDAEYYSVYEAGFCGFWIHWELCNLGINNIVVNPADVPTMAGERLRKTDAVDSGKLARSLRAGELKGIYVPDSVATEIRSLIRLRDSLTKDQTRHKNRIKSHLRYLGIDIPEEFQRPGCAWTNKFVLWLKGLELETDYGKKTLDLLIAQYEDLRAQQLKLMKELRVLSRTERFEEPLKYLMSVPGIGQLAGLTILSEVDDITRFKDASCFASYIGIVPMCHSSGAHDGIGDITVRRHAKLRWLIVEAAWVASRKDPVLSAAYVEYCRKMKPSKAIIKIARRLVNRIYFVMKHQQPYVNCYVS